MADPTPYADIGLRIQRIRLAFSSLSQREWAEKHSVSATQYNNWEKGVRRIPVEQAERLADLYGVDLDFIYRGKVDGLSENARKLL